MKLKKTLIALLGPILLLMMIAQCVSANEDECTLYKPGAVYTMDNDYCGNNILVFRRAANGILSPDGVFPTGGWGSGGPLGNQGGLILSHNGQWLFACNPDSNDISVFRVVPKGLKLVQRIYSQGQRPISLTLHGCCLYVLNAGGAIGCEDSIAGFCFKKGKLCPIPDSIWPLSAENTGPAQIGFSGSGNVLVVTEKATNLIDTYELHKCQIKCHKIFNSLGETPFGFAFRKNVLIISEAFGGGMGASAASSYMACGNGVIKSLTPSLPTTRTAACWVVITKNGKYAYMSNTGDGTITGLFIDKCGKLHLLDPDGITGKTGEGSGPIDLALSVNSQFLYSLNSGNGTIVGFKVKSDGSLKALSRIGKLPLTVNGLAAH